jgi:hypothetical protein
MPKNPESSGIDRRTANESRSQWTSSRIENATFRVLSEAVKMFMRVCFVTIAAAKSVLIEAVGRSAREVYWRFISGFSPIGSSRGHAKQTVQFMQLAQSRINTGDCASR